MSVPLDRLYNYINSIIEKIHNDPILIYRFYPHGSKKIEDLTPLVPITKNWINQTITTEIFCNDQEPLNHKLYAQSIRIDKKQFTELCQQHNIKVVHQNFRGPVNTVWDHSLLLHSEKRSAEILKYQNDEFISVYYWSHGMIAQDWFRYAEHVKKRNQVCKTFLIYNRAWAGTREYRLRFAELLIHLNLQEHCKTSINPVEPELGLHYETHKFKNPAWRPQTVLENYFPTSTAHSHYSADFDIEDYESTDIEVVLETLFDDSRLHLTEKSLRPIACAQPFILAGTHGSLEYLRSYGFKTFGDVWDESYDLVEDPAERLIQIAELMKYISNWLPHQRERNMAQAQAIADYNKQHFFSDKFFNQITGELKTNLTSAFAQLEAINTSKYFSERRKIFSSDPDLAPFGKKNKSDKMSKLIEERMQHYNMRSLNCVNK
jgi:hypothetical protein